jgi:flavodoxin
MVVKTFLENNDLSGKTVIPFSTNAGSGWGSSLTDLKNLCPNSTIIDGFSIAGTNAKNAQKEVNAWLDGLKKE